MYVPAPRRNGKKSASGGGLLDCLRGPIKMQRDAEISPEHTIPLEWQKVTFPANAEWARFHHEWTWLWQAVCVTYPASFHLPDSPYAWNASSSASSSVTGGTRDLWGSREHFLILLGCNFPAWLIVLLTVAKGSAQVGSKGERFKPWRWIRDIKQYCVCKINVWRLQGCCYGCCWVY